jgi:hypothetical protein
LKHTFRRGAAIAVAAVTGVAAAVAALAPGSGAKAAASVSQWRLANVWVHTQGQAGGRSRLDHARDATLR